MQAGQCLKMAPWRATPLFTGGLALALLAGPTGAHAQATSNDAQANAPLQEVVVVARRREEPLEQTPLAVTAQSGQELHDESATLLEDVARAVPNTRMISSPQSVSALDITIRGQTVNRSAIMFDPAVGLYVDGVYVANGQGAMATLLDVGSIEVLRGSQGTLFGRDNTGGSVLLFTHRPDLQQAEAEFALSGGDYREFMDRAIINVPISNDFALRFAYQDNQHAGFGSSLGSGQDDLENQHRYQARVGALWKPDQTSDVYFTYERFDAREYGAILHPLTGPPPGTYVEQIGEALSQFPVPGLPTVRFPSNPYQSDGSLPGFDNATTDSLQLTAEQKVEGAGGVKLILGYRRLNATTALDVDSSPLPLADTELTNTSEQRSAELQLNGKSLDDHLDWVGGLYWFQDNGGAPSIQEPASPAFLTALGEVAALSGGAANFTSLFSPLPVYDQNSVSNRSIAAYLHGEYQLTPDWWLAAGLRRTGDRRELSENDYVILPGLGENCTIGGTGPGPCPAIDKSVSYGFWSWELSSRWQLSPQLNAYVRSGRSQRSGGWNSPLASPDDEPFKPEQLTDYELGLKANLGNFIANGDVFYGFYDNMQRLLAQLDASGTPVTLVTNAGSARVSGAELELQWRATSHVELQNSFGWTDARYKTFLYQPIAGGPVENLAGNQFYQTPRLQDDIAGSYRVPTDSGEVLLRADYDWQSKIQFNVINDFNYQTSYGTLNARIALDGRAHTWELALFADNLSNQRYAYTGGTVGAPLSPIPTIAWNIPGARRIAGIEGTYRWSSSGH